jgi:hypothetical protein
VSVVTIGDALDRPVITSAVRQTFTGDLLLA